jgi:hypothetical protein
MTTIRFLMILLASLVVACAPNPKKEAMTWVHAGKRTVQVRVWDKVPPPDYEVHVSTAGKGAAKGAVEGAGGALSGGLQIRGSGDPLGLVLGVVLMPVFALGGAVVGAASAEPEVHYHGLDEVEGATELFEAAAQGPDLVELLRRRIENRSRTPSGHTLQFVAHDADIDQGAARMTIAITDYSLVGELSDDPAVRLFVEGSTSVGIPEDSSGYLCIWSYESSSRRLSVWRKNNAELFRREIERASESIFDDVVRNLEQGKYNCTGREHESPWIADQRRRQRDKELYDLAVSGDPESRYELAIRSRNAEEAWRWFCLAAHQGHGMAQYSLANYYRYSLANFYRSGRTPVEQDFVRAYLWQKLSAETGYEYAAKALPYTEQEMTTDQITEANLLVKEWEPNPNECETDGALVVY